MYIVPIKTGKSVFTGDGAFKLESHKHSKMQIQTAASI